MTTAQQTEREVLIEAFNRLHPTPLGGHWDKKWSAQNIRFRRMLDAEAYLSAAEMLVPEGCQWLLDSHYNIAKVARYWDDPNHGPQCDIYEGEAETPALALVAAILKAGEAR